MNAKCLYSSLKFHTRAFTLGTLLTLLFVFVMVINEYPVLDYVPAYAVNWGCLFILSGLCYGFFGKRRMFRFMAFPFDNLVMTYSLLGAVVGGVTAALAAGYGSDALDPAMSFIPVFTVILCLVYAVNVYRKHTMRMKELPIFGLRWSDDLYQTKNNSPTEGASERH